MPQDRLTHPRIGHSRKVCTLTDTEYRVWDTYKWSSDDYGILPKHAPLLVGMNEALGQHPLTVIEAAIETCVGLGLLVEFRHQDMPYVCSLNWQTHQKVKYPRATFYPCPPWQVLERMDVPTRELFKNFHAEFPKISKNSAPRARGRARHAHANANAYAEAGGERERGLVDDLLDHYTKQFSAMTGAAPHLGDSDRAAVQDLLAEGFPVEIIRTAMGNLFEAADNYVRETGYGLPLFAKQINQYLAKAATNHHQRRAEPWFWAMCPHHPKCSDFRDCKAMRQQVEAPTK